MATAGLALLALGAGGRGARSMGPSDGLLGSWVSEDVLLLEDDEAWDFLDPDATLSSLRFDPDGRWWIFESDFIGDYCRHVELRWQADADSLRQMGNPERCLAYALDSTATSLDLTTRQGQTRSYLRLADTIDTTGCPRDVLILLGW